MPHFSAPTGLWLPLITPFLDGELDTYSLRKLVRHYSGKGISGIILAATTGEGMLLDKAELEQLVSVAAEELASSNTRIPLFMGISGTDPRRVCLELENACNWPLDGFLISGPNYLRPSQKGLELYFKAAANCTDRQILIYNIPYRTGSNILNDTMMELAKVPNIAGVKDCCGDTAQSYELLRSAPNGFSVLTGEDPFFYNALTNGAPGAIVTGAHVLVDCHLEIIANIDEGKGQQALEIWNSVVDIPRLLFAEPSPAPVKYWLWRSGLIRSPEIRLPFLPVSGELATKIDNTGRFC